eukprot:COSAG01_NODE_4451_length_5007_cov_5.064181_7_plen_45_part_00
MLEQPAELPPILIPDGADVVNRTQHARLSRRFHPQYFVTRTGVT